MIVEDDPEVLSVESGVPVIIVTSDNKSKVIRSWVFNVKLDSVGFLWSIEDETNCPLEWLAVTVVEVGPNTFNIWSEIDVLICIGLSFWSVAGS